MRAGECQHRRIAIRHQAKYVVFSKVYELESTVRNTLPASEVRDKFAEITGRVRLAGTRFAIQKDGEIVAGLVPPSDLEVLEALEDRLDLLDALDALADYRTNGAVDFEDLKVDLDL